MLSFIIAVLIYGSFFLALHASLCPVRCREKNERLLLWIPGQIKQIILNREELKNKKGKIKRPIILRERSIIIRGRSIIMREINNH
ncbi:MAG: hypothetical protein AB9861_17650 [Methanosarcina sp.]